MTSPDPALRLHPWASLLLFLSAYSPLLLILVIKDYDSQQLHWLPQHPLFSAALLLIAIGSCIGILHAVRDVQSGLSVEVTKASNKSGEMFGYTIPYMVSFLRIDLGDWQTLLSLFIFLAMLFVVAYRTQTVFVNPVLALAGYMLIDCTFKRGATETQALVITKAPLKIGESYVIERMSHYLYIVAHPRSCS
ncbi:MAG: hypothetical protein HY028_03200 [Gammaproteobacteria bacterium]|nr:hypothetical protein [Gammaproteobacteria bacterium]